MNSGKVFVVCPVYQRHDEWNTVEPYLYTLRRVLIVEKVCGSRCPENLRRMKETAAAPQPHGLHNVRLSRIWLTDKNIHPAAAQLELPHTFEVPDGELLDHGGSAAAGPAYAAPLARRI